MNQAVHQIRYDWSPSTLLGTRGMGPVRTTLSENGLGSWDRHLRDHVWAVGPDPAFTFVAHSGIGALVRKVTTVGDDGRQGSAAHVLLCRELSAQHALGLASWTGWDTLDPDVLSWSALAPAADRGVRDLRCRAQSLPPERLASLFAQVLGGPGEGYTVIGEADPLAVTCALGDLIGRTPTFASDEADDSGRHLPTVVFLRQAPVSVTAAARRRLVHTASSPEPIVAGFAVAAVDAYTADGVDGVAHVQRAEPPVTAEGARAWADAAQFAPGVLADLARLPRLRREVLANLVRPEALERIRAVAGGASARDLGNALDRRLPDQVLSILVDEAARRVFIAPTDRELLKRLAAVGPLPLDLVARHAPRDLDRVANVARALLSMHDGRVLLERIAAAQPYADVVRWIDDRAAADPDNARTVYGALCSRTKVSIQDVRVLMACGVLIDAVRQFADTEQQVSGHLVALLGALPKRTLGLDAVVELAARADPVLLHALDAVLTDPVKREVIHRQIRLAYYHAHHLDEPATTAKGNGLRSLVFRRPTDHRKQT
ncbi:hypothetical protein [Actinocrispum wychmicini]|uniref:Uncharacterized protein n=1 Tax=Actinocrispum wychmicini TaxID=1213861 RepID=A0A4R2JF66_9PSEU|nr:hypothetical protein [Actinocrispum wychmicini]TCO52875.1 hypothetical protein EV192_11169 [Actinocrispum wychmicini]